MLAAVSVWSAPAGAAAQAPSNGPLSYEEGSPIHRVSYTAPMEIADPVAAGSLVTTLSLGISNIFEQDSTDTHWLHLDLERLSTTLTLRYGVSERLEVGGRILMETTGPGGLDGAIEGWHDLLGLGQANRHRFPQDDYAQILADESTTYLDVPRRDLAFEDARLFAKVLLARADDGSAALSAKGAVRVPGSSNPMASERADVALAVLARYGRGGWYGHAMLGAATARASEELAPVLTDGSAFFGLALERSFGGLSALVQYQVQSAVLRTFEHREIDRAASNLVLGLSGRLGKGWSFDASFQEDIPADTPAIDFTLGLRVSRHW